MKRTWILPLAAMLVAAPASAQMQHGQQHGMQHDGGSLAGVRGLYETARGYILAAAEQVPEEHYSFKPTPEVRSFGQLLGHIANAGYMFCAPVRGEQPPRMSDAEQITSKAELVSALRASFEYCDGAYAVDPMKAAESMQFFGQEHTGLSVLAFNMGHDMEHYGNIVTYMRLKGMTPPSSQRGM